MKIDFSADNKDAVYQKKKRRTFMQKYECSPCGYVYNPEEGDPEGGIAPGTPIEDIPDDWVCPVWGVG